MASFYRLDTAGWPLVVATFDGVADSDAEFLAFLEEVSVFRRGEPYALVLDASEAQGATARQRRLQADWLAENHASIQTHCMGISFVMKSALVRGMATAVMWLSPMPCEYRFCATVGEARAWCEERLRERIAARG